MLKPDQIEMGKSLQVSNVLINIMSLFLHGSLGNLGPLYDTEGETQ